MKYLEPFTDEKMEWDGDKYVLTRAYVKQNFESITYRDDGTLDKRRVKNSRVVYHAIQDRFASMNAKLGMFVVNHTEEGRKFLLDVLTEQMDADLQSGYNDLGTTSSINVVNGQVIDKDAIRGNILCQGAEILVDNPTAYFPFNIFFKGPYPWNVRMAIYGIKG